MFVKGGVVNSVEQWRLWSVQLFCLLVGSGCYAGKPGAILGVNPSLH